MTNNPNSLISKPDWLRVKAPQIERIGNTANLLNDLSAIQNTPISKLNNVFTKDGSLAIIQIR